MDWGLKQQTYFSQLSRLGVHGQGGCSRGSGEGRPLVYRLPWDCHTAEGVEEASSPISPHGGTTLMARGPPSRPCHLPETPLSNTILSGLRFQHTSFGRTRMEPETPALWPLPPWACIPVCPGPRARPSLVSSSLHTDTTYLSKIKTSSCQFSIS